MTTRYCLFYKEFHTDRRTVLVYCESYEQAQARAAHMIESFKYWGGGSVPVTVSASKWNSRGKYAGEVFPTIDYDESLYIEYARENGTKYGYYKDMQKIQKTRTAA